MKSARLFLLCIVTVFTSCKHKEEIDIEPRPARICQLIEEKSAHSSVKYIYDSAGILIRKETSPQYYTKYFYDSTGRLSKEEYWENNHTDNGRAHIYSDNYKTDSVFALQYSPTHRYLNNVFTFNDKNQLIKNKIFLGRSTPLHSITFTYYENGNLGTAEAEYENGDKIPYRYEYDDKISPYPKQFLEYVPTALSNNNVTGIFTGSDNEHIIEKYEYVYNDDGYPVKKLVWDKQYPRLAADTFYYIYNCK